jgi:hypothetical protein
MPLDEAFLKILGGELADVQERVTALAHGMATVLSDADQRAGGRNQAKAGDFALFRGNQVVHRGVLRRFREGGRL